MRSQVSPPHLHLRPRWSASSLDTKPALTTLPVDAPPSSSQARGAAPKNHATWVQGSSGAASGAGAGASGVGEGEGVGAGGSEGPSLGVGSSSCEQVRRSGE